MSFVTIEDFLERPDEVVDTLFSPTGPMSAEMNAMGMIYTANPVQIAYAKTLAAAAVRGCGEATGFVTPIEGSTGVGKSVAILSVCLLTAVLRKKPALITTYTRFLNRQIVGPDGSIAAAAVAKLVGRTPVLSLFRPRSAFASPSACRETAASIKSDQDASSPESAEALLHLADWTEASLERFTNNEHACVTALDGLIETFFAEHPDTEIHILAVPYDLYTLSSSSPGNEQTAYKAYNSSLGGSDLLVATHAALIRDRTSGGNMIDQRKQGFSFVVIDEANRLEDAGRLALGIRRSASALAREGGTILSAMSADNVSMDVRKKISEIILNTHMEQSESLLEEIREIGQKLPKDETQYNVNGSEPWIEKLRHVHSATCDISKLLKHHGGDAVAGALRSVDRRGSEINEFLECVDLLLEKQKLGGTLPNERRRADFRLPILQFSPTKGEPSISLVPKAGSKAVSLLWRGKQSLADAIVLTSATLATPGIRGDRAFQSILSSVGLEPSSNNVNHDLISCHEMRQFGKVKGVVLASPEAPLPSKRPTDDDPDFRNPDWLAYVGRGIAAAYNDTWRDDGANRVTVLTTSFADAEAIGQAVNELIQSDSNIIVRGPSDALVDGLNRLENLNRGILITTGAWDGVNRPGLMDHLVVPRIPFSPGKAGAFTWTDEQGDKNVSRRLETVLRILRQGLGRPIRSVSDETKFWVLDPRIGLPDTVQSRELVLPHPQARPILLSAFPDRFRRDVNQAVIFPVAKTEIQEATP